MRSCEAPREEGAGVTGEARMIMCSCCEAPREGPAGWLGWRRLGVRRWCHGGAHDEGLVRPARALHLARAERGDAGAAAHLVCGPGPAVGRVVQGQERVSTLAWAPHKLKVNKNLRIISRVKSCNSFSRLCFECDDIWPDGARRGSTPWRACQSRRRRRPAAHTPRDQRRPRGGTAAAGAAPTRRPSLCGSP